MAKHSDHVHVNLTMDAYKATAISFRDLSRAIAGMTEQLDLEAQHVSIKFSSVVEEDVQVIGWIDDDYVPRWKIIQDSLVKRIVNRGWTRGPGYMLGLNEAPVSKNRTLWNLKVRLKLGVADSPDGRYPSIGYRMQHGVTVGTEYLYSMGDGNYVMMTVLSLERATTLT